MQVGLACGRQSCGGQRWCPRRPSALPGALADRRTRSHSQSQAPPPLTSAWATEPCAALCHRHVSHGVRHPTLRPAPFFSCHSLPYLRSRACHPVLQLFSGTFSPFGGGGLGSSFFWYMTNAGIHHWRWGPFQSNDKVAPIVHGQISSFALMPTHQEIDFWLLTHPDMSLVVLLCHHCMYAGVHQVGSSFVAW